MGRHDYTGLSDIPVILYYLQNDKKKKESENKG